MVLNKLCCVLGWRKYWLRIRFYTCSTEVDPILTLLVIGLDSQLLVIHWTAIQMLLRFWW